MSTADLTASELSTDLVELARELTDIRSDGIRTAELLEARLRVLSKLHEIIQLVAGEFIVGKRAIRKIDKFKTGFQGG